MQIITAATFYFTVGNILLRIIENNMGFFVQEMWSIRPLNTESTMRKTTFAAPIRYIKITYKLSHQKFRNIGITFD